MCESSKPDGRVDSSNEPRGFKRQLSGSLRRASCRCTIKSQAKSGSRRSTSSCSISKACYSKSEYSWALTLSPILVQEQVHSREHRLSEQLLCPCQAPALEGWVYSACAHLGPVYWMQSCISTKQQQLDNIQRLLQCRVWQMSAGRRL